MNETCKYCELPEIAKDIDRYGNAIDAAKANIKASSSEREAHPFIMAAQKFSKELIGVSYDLQGFINRWSGICDDCPHEA